MHFTYLPQRYVCTQNVNRKVMGVNHAKNNDVRKNHFPGVCDYRSPLRNHPVRHLVVISCTSIIVRIHIYIHKYTNVYDMKFVHECRTSLQDWIFIHYDCTVNAGMRTYMRLIIYSVGALRAVITI